MQANEQIPEVEFVGTQLVFLTSEIEIWQIGNSAGLLLIEVPWERYRETLVAFTMSILVVSAWL
jgi:hypothetical protein